MRHARDTNETPTRHEQRIKKNYKELKRNYYIADDDDLAIEQDMFRATTNKRIMERLNVQADDNR